MAVVDLRVLKPVDNKTMNYNFIVFVICHHDDYVSVLFHIKTLDYHKVL